MCAKLITAYFTDKKSEAQRSESICFVVLTTPQRRASWGKGVAVHVEADPGKGARGAASPGISRIPDPTCHSNASKDPPCPIQTAAAFWTLRESPLLREVVFNHPG